MHSDTMNEVNTSATPDWRKEEAKRFVDWYFGKKEHWSVHDTTRAGLMQERLEEVFSKIESSAIERTVREIHDDYVNWIIAKSYSRDYKGKTPFGQWKVDAEVEDMRHWD